MNPILILDDDQDDLNLLRDVAAELDIKRPILFFKTGNQLVSYLHNTEIEAALVICDINMPEQNGFELKQQLNNDPKVLRKKLSFVYLTTGTTPDYINKATKLSIDGFYRKSTEYSELKKTLATILERCS